MVGRVVKTTTYPEEKLTGDRSSLIQRGRTSCL
jgi:hypothetical protein